MSETTRRKPWVKLDEPKWDPEGNGWIATARVVGARKMEPSVGHKTVRAHTITLEISEVDSASAIYRFLLQCLVDNKDVTIRVEQDPE